MSQSSIKVDAGTGSAVDFSTLTTSGNYRQVVVIGDPTTDANYATVDSSGNLHVVHNSSTITAILNNSTITALFGQSTIIAIGANSTITAIFAQSTITAIGDVASGSADSGNPLKVGYVAATALPTAVSGTQRVNSMADKFGRIVSIPQAPRDLIGSSYTSIATNVENTIVAAQGAGIFADVSSIIIANTGNTAVTVDIRDVTAGTIIKSYIVPSLETRGGVFSVPWPQTTANTSWTAQLSTTVTAKVAVEFIKNK